MALVQKRSALHSHRRTQVSKVLKIAAEKFHDPRLSTLAVHARLDAFTKVKKSIQDMIDKLVEEQEDEVKHKDFCVDEINTNEKDTQRKDQQRNTLVAKIEDEDELINKMKKSIEQLNAEEA